MPLPKNEFELRLENEQLRRDAEQRIDTSLVEANARLKFRSERVESLERELAETRAIIDKEAKDYAQTYLDNQALAAQALKMREALEKIHGTAAPYDDGVKFRYIKDIAVDALAINTKPAEQIVNVANAKALRRLATEQYSGFITCGELHRLADELEKKV